MEEKYRRPDIEGGYIYDKADIEYYKATQRVDVIDNGLLGDYNMVGAYVVNKSIVEELLKLKKVYTDTFGKSIFCESLKLFDNMPIKFRLNITSGVPTHTKITATLELMEDIKRVNGFYSNINTVLLTSKVYDDKKDIYKKIFKDFNILELNRDESGAKVEKNFDVRNILLRKDLLDQLKDNPAVINYKLEKSLFEKRMKVLLSSSKCASLIEEFNRQVFHCRAKFLNKNDKNYYRYINQILDGVFQAKGYELEDSNIWDQLKAIELDYSNEINNRIDFSYSKQVELEEIRHTRTAEEYKNKIESQVSNQISENINHENNTDQQHDEVKINSSQRAQPHIPRAEASNSKTMSNETISQKTGSSFEQLNANAKALLDEEETNDGSSLMKLNKIAQKNMEIENELNELV